MSTIELTVSALAVWISSAAMGVITPLLTVHYSHMYFAILLMSGQLVIIFFIAMLILKFPRPRELRLLGIVGFLNAIMSVSMLYASRPDRTPVVLQAILPGTSIITSVTLTRYVLAKPVKYNFYYIVPSSILLIIAILMPFIYMFVIEHEAHSNDVKFHVSQILWILLYVFGVSVRTASNIMQEKYMRETKDPSTANKVSLSFYTRIVSVIVISAFFWIDGLHALKQDGDTFIHDREALLLLESWVALYAVLYVASVYLNGISTNYNTVIGTAANPMVAIFFTIFSKLNPGIQYPLWITVPSLVASVTSALLWMQGDKVIEEYTQIGNVTDSINTDDTITNVTDTVDSPQTPDRTSYQTANANT